MDIEPLYELKERLNISVIAGISLMTEDVRLKRAVEQIEPLSKVDPIFAQIYQGALRMFEVPCEQRADALFEELALIRAALITQAKVEIEGEWSAISVGMRERVVTDVPCSIISLVQSVLTASSNGQYSILLKMRENSPESFRDFRIRFALVAGLGAECLELAYRIEQWLYEDGESVLPFLKHGFLPDGEKEMVRRVHVIEKIAKEKENNWYLEMLDTAEKEVREALIYALRHEKQNEEYVFHLIQTEKGKGKKAAIWALSYMDSPKVYEYLKNQLENENKNYKNKDRLEHTFWEDGYFYLSKSEQASDLVAEEIHRELDNRIEQVKRGKDQIDADKRKKLSQLFAAMIGKTSDAMLTVYKRLAETNLFSILKDTEHPNEPCILSYWNAPMWEMSREPCHLAYVDRLLMKSILFTEDSKLYQLAWELYQEHGESFLPSAFVASLLSRDGKSVFSAFSHYLTANQKKAGRHAMMEAFASLSYDTEWDSYVLTAVFQEAYRGEEFIVKRKIYGEFDFRWLELLTDEKIKKDGVFRRGDRQCSCFDNRKMATWNSVLERLIRPNDEKNCTLLGRYFCKLALNERKGKTWKKFLVVEKCGVKVEPEVVMDYMKKMERKNFWELEELIRSIPMKHEEKMAVLTTIRKLIETKEMKVDGWYESRYRQLFDEL